MADAESSNKRKSPSPQPGLQHKRAKVDTEQQPAAEDTSPLAFRSSARLSHRGGHNKSQRVKNDRRQNKDDAYHRKSRKGEEPVEVEDGEEREKRLPKRKVAVLIGYCGTGLSGSQINPGVNTVEGEIFDALVKAACISADNSTNPGKVSLLRSARTDAGVHAAVNCLSLKLILNPPSLPSTSSSLVDHINSFLRPQLRIWSIIRVQNSFNPRTMCDSRCYDYLLPTYVFLPPKLGTSMAKAIQDAGLEAYADFSPKEGEEIDLGSVEASQFWSAVSHLPSSSTPDPSNLTTDETADAQLKSEEFVKEMALKRKWRLSSSPLLLEELRAAARVFEGYHNFHNFTVQKEFHDRSAMRTMKKLTISEPFLVGESEWISIKVHGQSFMLHQIRKMIGLLILVIRTRTPASLIPETFSPTKIHIPKSPSLGLLLEKPLFDGYNKKVEETNKLHDAIAKKTADKAAAKSTTDSPDGPGVSKEESKEESKDEESAKKEPLVYSTQFELQVDAFKKEFIYDKLYQEELISHSFARFLNLLDTYSGPDFDYLNKQGIIPSSCVFVNGKLPGASKTKNDNELIKEEDEEQLIDGADEG